MSGAMWSRSKRDAVEPDVIDEFQRLGCSVQPLNGKDYPDLLVGIPTGDGGVTVLVEVKTNNAALRPGQEKWHAAWRGGRPHVVRNAAQARKVVVMAQSEGGGDWAALEAHEDAEAERRRRIKGDEPA